MTTYETETEEEKAKRLALEERAADVGRVIAKLCPPGVGFTLLLFDFGEGGHLAYMSNGQRDDVVRAMREFIERMQ